MIVTIDLEFPSAQVAQAAEAMMQAILPQQAGETASAWRSRVVKAALREFVIPKRRQEALAAVNAEVNGTFTG